VTLGRAARHESIITDLESRAFMPALYLLSMTSPPPQPPGPPDRPPAQGESERFGPLCLQRYRKDDGRALLLFSRAVDPLSPAGRGAGEGAGRERQADGEEQ
jgi:hypothetical protein